MEKEQLEESDLSKLGKDVVASLTQTKKGTNSLLAIRTCSDYV